MDSGSIAVKAVQAVNNNQLAYSKFLSANDTGDTGAHQAGIYIAKNAIAILFDEPGARGENKDKFVKIKWQGDFTTDSRFIYYGRGTRNEYRITRFDRGFPFLRKEHVGDLFVLIKLTDEDYSGYVLETEDDINYFLDAFGMSPTDTGNIIQKDNINLDTSIEIAIIKFIDSLAFDFPASADMSAAARRIFSEVYKNTNNIEQNPDKGIISWIDMEYRLFRKLEYNRYGDFITQGFKSVDEFIVVANTVLNRRKSRAGKSLEHHLTATFEGNSLPYSYQPRTEGNKRPDFLFPSEAAYHNFAYSSDKLVFLGAKTTCKDRWRQVINEANRITHKHLFTLQQGISTQQLDEMADEHITLVVPQPYISTYPKERQDSIWTLKKFIDFTKEKISL